MTLYQFLRTYIITPPLSASAFTGFWFFGVVAWPFDRDGSLTHRVARVWSWWLLNTAGIRIRIEGTDRLDPHGTYIYVSNHLSLADTPFTTTYLPTIFRFLAKESLMKVPIIGGHLRRGRHISVPREDARGAARALAKAADLLRAKTASVLIFAEGTRGEGAMQAFKAGAAHLAIQTGVPVVPVAIAGTDEVLPKGAPLLRPGSISMVVGEPIPSVGLTAADRGRFTTQLQENVSRLLERAEALRRA
ncbi:MAG: lysophospholipid acyltransferase family protein [Bryobacteraceae bacterium]